MNRTTFQFALLFLLLAVASASSQDRDAETAKVKSLVDECGPSRSKSIVLTRSLVKTDGRIAKFDAESLYFKRGRKYFRVLHRDVLEIRCLDKSVSHVPDPLTRPYGEWRDINQVYAGTRIVIVLIDGTKVKGMSNSATDSHLIIFDPETNARRDISKDKVSACIAFVDGKPGAVPALPRLPRAC